MLCPLCREQTAQIPTPMTRTWDVQCPNCGHFYITFESTKELSSETAIAFDLACWVYGQNMLGASPKIDSSALDLIKTYPRPSTRKRAELYLGRIIRILDGKLLGRFEPDDARLRVASWSYSNEDSGAIADYLTELGAVKRPAIGTAYSLQAKGHVIYDELAVQRIVSSQAFIAMWFDTSMDEALKNGFVTAIDGAGYYPLRIDRKEHDDKIDDQIIAEIRRSAFVVADFTGNRPNVYYEAGFAHGLGRRVLFTCKQDDRKDLRFDIRQFNVIEWERPEDIVAPLRNRILALFGAGLYKPDAKPIPI